VLIPDGCDGEVFTLQCCHCDAGAREPTVTMRSYRRVRVRSHTGSHRGLR
jgi:hypothetical protein